MHAGLAMHAGLVGSAHPGLNNRCPTLTAFVSHCSGPAQLGATIASQAGLAHYSIWAVRQLLTDVTAADGETALAVFIEHLAGCQAALCTKRWR